MVTVIAPAAARTAPESRVCDGGGGGQRHVSNANGLPADFAPKATDATGRRSAGCAPRANAAFGAVDCTQRRVRSLVTRPRHSLRSTGRSASSTRGVLDRRRHRLVHARRRSPAWSCAGSCPTGSSAAPAPRRPPGAPPPRRSARRTSATSSARSSSSVRSHAGLQHHEPARHLALERVRHADDGALGDVGVRGQHLLHPAGGEPVPGDVDHVVGAAHHEQVAVVVEVPAVAGQVVAVVGRQVRPRRSARRRSTGSAARRAAAAA